MFSALSGTELIILFVALVISISIHEAMHAFTSYWLGDDTAKMEGRITLNPLAHIDPVMTILLPMLTIVFFGVPFLAAKPVPFNPMRVRFEEFGAALVGIVGPFTNLVLAAAGAGILNLFESSLSSGVQTALFIWVALNVGLFVFNMIPIPPLDGSRLLYALAPEPVQRFMASLEQFGIFIILALLVGVPAFTDLLIELNQTVRGFLL